jgi:hypothetical protein
MLQKPFMLNFVYCKLEMCVPNKADELEAKHVA